MKRPAQGGFTLIELSLSLLLASVLGAGIFGIVYMQSLAFAERLEEYDLHQNARAALNLLRTRLLAARYGLATHPEAAGIALVGQCPSITSFYGGTQCNNVGPNVGGTGRTDALQLIAVRPGVPLFSGDANFASLNTCDTNGPDTGDPRLIHNNVPAMQALRLGGIGGSCQGGTPVVANDVLRLGSDSPGGGCAHRYASTPVNSSTLSCPQGYAAGFGFGALQADSFYTGTVTDGTPVLMVATATDDNAPQTSVVAFNVEDFQVVYGIDLTDPADSRVDIWCADPRSSADASPGCAPYRLPVGGTPYTSQQMVSRIVAVKVAVRVRTDRPRPDRVQGPLDPNWLVDNPIADPNDGYLRMIASTTVALRNAYVP
jgi:prepilin-type N-terminal cleavage/methylation domain-containing protein